MAAPRVVTVEINGQRYPIRTTLDPDYVQELATYVDTRMRRATEASPSSDSVGLAVLAALNIADELFRMRDVQADEAGSLTDRTAALERIVDEALQLAGHRD
jgi:cell division protein ZapA